MAPHKCIHEKEIADHGSVLFDGDNSIVKVQARHGVKLNIILWFAGIVTIAFVGRVAVLITKDVDQIRLTKQYRQERLYRDSQYYQQRDWIDPDAYAIDDDNHSAEFGTLDF